MNAVMLVPFEAKGIMCALCPNSTDYYITKDRGQGARRVYICKACMREMFDAMCVRS